MHTRSNTQEAADKGSNIGTALFKSPDLTALSCTV